MARYNPDLKELIEYLRYMQPKDVRVLRDTARKMGYKPLKEDYL